MNARIAGDEKGLTILELLIVIVILGILSAIATPSVLKIIENSKKEAHLSNAKILANAAQLYMINENCDFDPVNHTYHLYFNGRAYNRNDHPYYDDLVSKGYITNIPKPPGSKKKYNVTNSYVAVKKDDDGRLVYKVRLVSDSEWPNIAYICDDKPVHELTIDDVEVVYKSENALTRCVSHTISEM